MPIDSLRRVCVYCASSRSAHEEYRDAARRLGASLAAAGVSIVYGGGSAGSMGALADGALGAGGQVIGVIPNFMRELEWGHENLSELHVVESMHERKRRMLEGTDAVIALPGGCGTLEELFEAVTLKRLGLYVKPIVLVNTRGFFDHCQLLLEQCVLERFMDTRHLRMWTMVGEPEDVVPAIAAAPPWSENARSFAAV